MKKLYASVLFAALVFNLASCGKDDDDKPVVVDPRDKFVGTFAGTMTCTPGGNQGANVQIVKGQTENELDIVGFGKATISGNSFTVPTQTTTNSGVTSTTDVSGTINSDANTLMYNRTTAITSPVLPTPFSTNCTGNLAKQ